MKTDLKEKLKYSECVDIGKLIGCSGEYVRQVATGQRNNKSTKAQLILNAVNILLESKRIARSEIEKLIKAQHEKSD